ncbi:hypothetical protein [Helicobacter pylori]|uniref:hypothetical protein n=1 Tax=Helicobacter pylori TaxID=210 RepID=UPI00165AA165|nr:hypothetical protein [Helicobacter pylori]
MAFNHSTIQPFNHSTIQPFNHSTIQPFNHSTIQSFNHSIIQAFYHSIILSFKHLSSNQAIKQRYHVFITIFITFTKDRLKIPYFLLFPLSLTLALTRTATFLKNLIP